MLESLAGLLAPAATMIAALMTAVNLGARVTGWGFVVFTAGSILWIIVGLGSGQTNLVATNVVLTLINIVGVWRWLGREARYEAVAGAAEQGNANPATPSVFAATAIAGRKIIAAQSVEVGEAVEAIIDCRTATISHVIMRFGGVGGVGETLVALRRDTLTFEADTIATSMEAAAVTSLPAVEAGKWSPVAPL